MIAGRTAPPRSILPGGRSEFGRPAGRRLLALTVLLAMIMAGMCLTSGAMLWNMRRDAWKQAVTASRNVVAAEASSLEQTMRIYDGSLRSAAAAFGDPVVMALPAPLRQRALFDRIQDAALLGPIRILDADGRVVADSVAVDPAPADGAELTALARHRARTDPGPALGPPVLLGAGGHAVTLSRRITRADGGFGGMVCGTIRLEHVTSQFRRLHIGRRDVVSLFSGDGVMLAHVPGDPLVGRRITGSVVMRRFAERRAGTIVAPGATDGVERVFTFAHVDGWPLLMDVGVSVSELYAPWRRKAAGIGLMLGVLGLGGAVLVLALRREVVSRLAAEGAARNSEARYRSLADGASDVILRLDRRMVRTYVSPSVRAMGYEPDDLLGRSLETLVHPEDRDTFAAAAAVAREGRPGSAVSYRVRCGDGSFRWVEARLSALDDGGMLAILRDIDGRKRTEFELEAVREELGRLSRVDPLTGLNNRRVLDEGLADALRRAQRDDEDVSVLIVDVDRFKEFNDRYGHLAGDEALRRVARAIGDAARRPGDLPVRFGGEEFALVLPGTDGFGAITVAEALRGAVTRAAVPHEGSDTGTLSVSIGVATVRPRRDGQVPAELLVRADAALYAAKHAGRNAVRAATDLRNAGREALVA